MPVDAIEVMLLEKVTVGSATRAQFKSVAQGDTDKMKKINITVAHAKPNKGAFAPNGFARIYQGAIGIKKIPFVEHT
jgi:hypothetical protein